MPSETVASANALALLQDRLRVLEEQVAELRSLTRLIPRSKTPTMEAT